MALDNEGNLKPLMLSELIATAQKALEEHGDMLVGVYTCKAGCDRNVEHSLPVSDPPVVERMEWMSDYWPERKDRHAFSISGG